MSTDPYNGSMDIGNPQSMNRYAYTGNDPVNSIDPDGLNDILSRCVNDVWYADSHAECPSPAGGGGGGWGGGIGIGIGIGIGGGGGGSPTPTPTPTPTTPPGSGPPIHFPNETNGLPDGFHFQQLSLCQAAGLCPLGPACDFGPCGFTDTTLPRAAAPAIPAVVACILAEPCGGILAAGTAIVLAGTAVVIEGRQYFGSRQTNEWSETAQKLFPQSLAAQCSWLRAQKDDRRTTPQDKKKIIQAMKYIPGCYDSKVR